MDSESTDKDEDEKVGNSLGLLLLWIAVCCLTMCTCSFIQVDSDDADEDEDENEKVGNSPVLLLLWIDVCCLADHVYMLL